MSIRSLAAVAAMVVLVAGCATLQQPVPLASGASHPASGRIGVAMTALPKQDTQVPGAGCLLCYAFASSANSALTTHAQTLPSDDLLKLKGEVAELFRSRGTQVTVIDEDLKLDALPDYETKGPNIARKDFSSLGAKYQVDKLLVINIRSIGFVRSYSAYVPTSDPKGFLDGIGYIVNLRNNTYEWYQPVSISKSAGQVWDEPPRFPALTNAYFQAIELGKDAFLKPFVDDTKEARPAGATAAGPVAANQQSTARVSQ